MTRFPRRRGRAPRRGIALIVALGLLAVLFVTSVAFAIFARMERMASGHHVAGVQARQMAQNALDRAIADISFSYDRAYQQTGIHRVYPAWDVFTPPAELEGPYFSGSASPVVCDLFQHLGVDGQVPTALQAQVQAAQPIWRTVWHPHFSEANSAELISGITDARSGTGAAHSSPRPPINAYDYHRPAPNYGAVALQTNLISVTTNGVTVTTNRIRRVYVGMGYGRTSYLAVNLSGLLDAETATPEQLELLDEIGSGAGFAAARTEHGGYTDYADLLHAQAGAGLSAAPRHLGLFHHDKPGMLNPGTLRAATANQVVDLSVPLEEMEDSAWEARFVAELTAAGGVAGQAARVYRALLDYVDEDVVPRTLDDVNTESVPMVNEVQVETRLATVIPDVTYRSETDIRVELFYPFLNAVTNEFRLEIGGRLYADSNQGARSERTFSAQSAWFTPDPEEYRVLAVPTLTDEWSAPAVSSFRYRVVVTNLQVRARYGGPPSDPMPDAVVDRVGTAMSFPSQSASTKAAAGPGTANPDTSPIFQVAPGGEARANAEALDPRLNWRTDRWWSWYFTDGGEGTLGGLNDYTAAQLDRPRWVSPSWPRDGTTKVFVRNGPLESVAEMGNLIYLMWESVKLYDPNGAGAHHKVYDHFTVRPLDGPGVRGQVNLNTPHVEALRAALVGMPVDDFPGQAGAAALDGDQAETLAQALVARRQFLSLGDLGRHAVLFDDSVFPSANELQRESLLRNLEGRVGLRGGSYLILAVGEDRWVTWSGNRPEHRTLNSNRGRPLAVARLMALVWMDSFPGPHGHRKAEIRYFRFLEEEL